MSGGGLVVKQSILSLSANYEIDYLGPEITDDLSRSKVNTILELKHNPDYSGMSGALFRGVTTGYYKSWLTKSAEIDWDSYTLVYLEYSRHGFIAQEVKKNSNKMVVRVHNVEKDYHLNKILDKKSLQNSIRSLIKRYFIVKQERSCLSNADCIICLTAADQRRLKDLYPSILRTGRLEVIPVAISQSSDYSDPPREALENIEKNPYLLITGSLWFWPNASGTAWFIKNVWHRLQTVNHPISKKYKLVIAGAKPGKELKSLLCRYKNIELIDTPGDMKQYFENASIYLAPIFSGAGMKVKVAEALSYGLPVVGTNHALNGYKIIDREDGYRADNADQFIDALEHYASLPVEAKKNIRVKAYKNYHNHHSIASSTDCFQQIIGSLE